jgi:hypothetical protein
MNFSCQRVGQFVVGVHTSIHPTQEEWEQLLDLARVPPEQHTGSLIYTEGGSPSALQRKQLRDAMVQAKIASQLSAVLTDSIIARTAITALNLFLGNRVRAFPSTAIDEGLTYIQAPLDVWPQIKQVLDELKLKVGANKGRQQE